VKSFSLLLILLATSVGPRFGSQPQARPAQLHLEVFTSSPNGFSVTSTLIYGDKELIVIDPQFLLSEARQLADKIRATKRTLTTIYTTHAHPDHFLGVAALKEQFPGARYVALPEVVERIKTAWPARRNFWFATYGNDLPSETPILPEPIQGQLLLEGNVLLITGEVMGDGPGNSFVYIPTLSAVVAGDIVFNNAHFAPPADPTALYATFDRIVELRPLVLVAGHQAQGSPNDPRAMNFMRLYIRDFEQFKAASSSAEELKKKMLAKYPKLALENLLDSAVSRAFPPPKQE
jgi:glyoxylase-like metal-dependent hydrolase (beta-lactamase superfamily II)